MMVCKNPIIRPTNAFTRLEKESTESSISESFRRQALMHPNRTALKIGHYGETYETLERSANRLAGAIVRKLGKDKQGVALLLGNDADLIRAVIGTLRAGKFYVPLDPSYPLERNQFIANDVGAALVITNNKNLRLAKDLVGDPSGLLNLDELDPFPSEEDFEDLAKPDDIAFIQYTSGSTGQPKGVMYTHRQVLHIALRYTNGQHITSDDRLLLLTSHSYGASVGNIFGGLLNGAVLCSFDVKEDGLDKLADWLIKEEVSIFYSVSTVFRRFAGGLTGGQLFPKLRLIRLGGEAVYRSDVELYKKHFHDNCLLHVGYAATETSIVREYFFDKRTPCDSEVTPVGYEVEDMEVLIVDDDGNSAGNDCIGEIAVRSRYISPGYWCRPDLTSAVFRSDPASSGARTYLTGDLGRMAPDGCLIHMGRKDRQVKVRGFRIELDEVEAVLLRQNGIKEAAVIAHQPDGAEQRLAAYLVVESRSEIDLNELRNTLRTSLPDFMVPATLTAVEALPRTPSGKVDRRQLEAVQTGSGAAGRDTQDDLTGPRGPVEARLIELWRKALGAGPISVNDDFFSLGGDSLTAAGIVAEIEAIYGIQIPASTLLRASTVEQLATIITSGQVESSSLVPLRASGIYPPFFCVHGIGGEVISFRDLASYLSDDQPFYALRARQAGTTIDSIEEMAGHYVDEIQQVQPEGPYLLGGYSFGGTIAFEIARQLVEKGESVSLLALFDTYGPGYPKLLPARKRLAIHGKKFIRATSAEKLRLLRERIRTNAIKVDNTVRKILYRYLMPSRMTRDLKAEHQRLLWKYVHKPFRGRIDLFRALDQSASWYNDPFLGWNGLAAGGIQVHSVPGDHISLMNEPNVAELARTLGECLSLARQETVTGTVNV